MSAGKQLVIVLVNLGHPIARSGFKKDWEAMQWAEAFVLVMPCGRSAHLEAGWAIGAGKPTAILLSEGEPELMYSMASMFEPPVGERGCMRWGLCDAGPTQED